MIERFNFYDVYGYLVPGLTLLVLLWLPFGISAPEPPEADLWSAVTVVVLAYVVGHMIQLLARFVWPTKTQKKGTTRNWHDVLLDADDPTFTEGAKEILFSRLETLFGINARAKGRDEAYSLCRAALVAGKVASYAEQFQGMYALMRGLAAAFWIGAAFHLGFSLRSFAAQIHPDFATGLLVYGGLATACALVALLIFWWRFWHFSDRAQRAADQERKQAESVRDQMGYALCICYTALAFAIGILFGNASRGQWSAACIPAILAISLVPLAYLCRQSHDHFARESAKAVYQYFLVVKEAKDD